VHREIEPAGDARAVDLRHPELAAALDVTEREVVGAVPFRGQTVGVLGLAGEITADTEPVAGAGEADRIELGLAVGPDRRPLQSAVHVLRECIALLDAVDAHVQHAVGDVRDQVRAPELGCLGLRRAHGSL
jgi:hypothetical protein